MKKLFSILGLVVLTVASIVYAVGPTTIGEWKTTGPLRVFEGPSGVATINDFGIVIESDQNANLNFHTPNDKVAQINFGDPEDNNEGKISFDHNTSNFSFVTEGNIPLTVQGDGDVILTVQDDGVNGTGSCPDGGNVCSGGSAGITCSNLGGNVASCTYDLEWVRVGNRVTVGIHGFADPNADAYSTWTALPLPGVGSGFPADAGRGACTWGYSTTITAGIITAEVGQTRARVEFRNTPGLDSRAWGCTIVYQIP